MQGEDKKLKSKKQKMPEWGKKLLCVLAMIVLLMVIIASVAYGAVYYQLGKIQRVDPNDTDDWVHPDDESFETDDISVEPPQTETAYDSNGNVVIVTPDTTTAPETDSKVDFDEIDPIEHSGLINILLVGQDKRPGEKRQRSDSMILVSINPETKDVSIISFLRDLYVQIPGGYSDNRLNVAYLYGGFKLLNETLLLNFGVDVDYNIEVDFTGFEKIIDIVGGVTINLTSAEAKYMGGGLTAGETKLNGTQALTYARIRKIDSDFGRTNRQRNILFSLFDTVKTLPIGTIYDMIDQICPYITTDMSNSEIFALAAKLVPMMTSMKLEQYHVPDNGQYYNAVIRKMMVLVPYSSKIRKALAEEYLPIS